MSTAFIALGSNLGESRQILRDAWQKVLDSSLIYDGELSSLYQSVPFEMESENLFYNAVGRIETDLAPLDLLAFLQNIEKEFGRKRQNTSKAAKEYQDRLLDLDLLYYGDECMESESLILPHPQRARRLFVLTPLAEIAPLWRDPVNKKSVVEMEQELRASLSQEELKEQDVIQCDK